MSRRTIHDLRSAVALKLISLALTVAPHDEKRPLASAIQQFAVAQH